MNKTSIFPLSLKGISLAMLLSISCSCLSKTIPKEKNWETVFKDSNDIVVQIFSYVSEYNFQEPFRTPDQHGSSGSGFFISEDGEILTNFHVINQSTSLYIQIPSLGKERFEVKAAGMHPERDVAKLRLTPESLKKIKEKLSVEKLRYFELGDSDELSEAQEIMAIGYPLGQENTKIAVGSFAGRESSSAGECIQTTAPVSPGNSGGSFVNKKGEVVGICVHKSIQQHAEGVAYLIPINNVKLMMDQLENGNIIKKPYWGCPFVPTTPQTLRFLGCPDDGGVYISKIKKGSLAEEYGLQQGDIIYQINNKKIDRYGYLDVAWSTSKASLRDFLSRIRLGNTITLTVYRNGEKLEISGENKSFDKHIIKKYYPWFEKPLEYEIIGGMVVVELTLNHILHYKDVIRQMPAEIQELIDFSSIEKYADEEERFEPRLIITTIYPSSPFHDTRCFKSADKIISKVNDIKVTTIEEFREAVLASKKTKHLTVETEGGAKVAVPLKEIAAKEELIRQMYHLPDLSKSELFSRILEDEDYHEMLRSFQKLSITEN